MEPYAFNANLASDDIPQFSVLLKDAILLSPQ